MGEVVRRLGFRRAFFAVSVFIVTASAGVAFAGLNFKIALFSRLLLGVSSSFFQIGLATFQAVTFKEAERGYAFSLIMVGGLAPMMTAVPLADWLLSRGYGRAYIFMPLILCIIVSIISSPIPGLDDAEIKGRILNKSAGTSLFAECAKIPALRISLFLIFLFSMTDAASTFMAPMTNSYGLMASYFLSQNAAAGVCVRLFFSKWFNRFPRWRLCTAAVLLMPAVLIAASVTPTHFSLIALGLLFGIGMGFGFPLNLALVSDSVPMRLQPQAVSAAWFIIGLNFALVPLCTGWSGSLLGPVTAFRITASAIFTGAIYLNCLWKNYHKFNLKSPSAQNHR